MTGTKSRSSRRAFFLSGGAVVGAGVATAVGASALQPDNRTSAEEQLKQLRQQLDSVADREAIRQLHLAFAALMEKQAYESAAELFDQQAHLDQYRRQSAPAMHSAYRQNTTWHHQDAITLSEDGLKAAATFHVDAEVCTPLEGDCTVVQMARLQGHVADRRWVPGRLEAKYVKRQGHWKIASLSYQAS